MINFDSKFMIIRSIVKVLHKHYFLCDTSTIPKILRLLAEVPFLLKTKIYESQATSFVRLKIVF